MNRFRKVLYICSFLLVGIILTACGQSETKQEDIDPKIWDDSLKAYEITSDYVVNKDFQLTAEEEKFLEDYMNMSNEVLLGDSDQYNEAEQNMVNEIVTIIHTVNIHRETQNERALNELEDNFAKLKETFGK
ncbi:hypothetical protein [Bacillus benzoevorans]|uniref:Uncharacterized protein n=1 Tax=Bacillus benzoevorans TaxID=1456 RepID=A0A7X0HTM2_9BACI|nr:hypothetical protein [Bacillus benzoevorans]MBB6446618.1 hypothetical protein [Bacillus benzoevorans]